MNRSIYIAVFALLIALSGCRKDPEVGGTAVQEMAGEWWVQLEGDPGNYYHFSTYNTAANVPTEMWIDDLETFWLMKGKVNVDIANLTFTGANVENVSPDYVGSGETFTIVGGKIIKDGAVGPASKAVTDSIYFQVSFSDDPVPGTVYTLSGYRRTRFSEDDH